MNTPTYIHVISMMDVATFTSSSTLFESYHDEGMIIIRLCATEPCLSFALVNDCLLHLSCNRLFQYGRWAALK